MTDVQNMEAAYQNIAEKEDSQNIICKDGNFQKLSKESNSPESSGNTSLENVTNEAGTDFEIKIMEYLESCVDIRKPPDITLEELIKHSKKFPIEIPIKTVCCEVLQHDKNIDKNILEKNINSAYPLINENVISLYVQFLEHKKMYGSSVEKALYSGMNLISLVQRLLEKRAVMFCSSADLWLLLDKSRGAGGWENVGTDREKSPLLLADCLSYDEMKLSALLSVSSHSVFTNDGSRHNDGVPACGIKKDDTEKEGVVIGLIGPRMRLELNEWQEIVITKYQNIAARGYGPKIEGGRSVPIWRNIFYAISSVFGYRTDNVLEPAFKWRRIWSDFYDLKPYLPLYSEVKSGERYVELFPGLIFDNKAYAKRLCVSFETLLLEANHRAKLHDKKAYIHMIGIGLGVWKMSPHQEDVFLETFALTLTKLLPYLSNISDINFPWFTSYSCGSVASGELFTRDGTSNAIRILFSKRSPHDRLTGEDSGKLLIVSYAWNGNALPGNDFWSGALHTSGDPAQAASSQIAELHNPHINGGKVSGDNLHIATAEWGVIHIAEYAKHKLKYPAVE